MNIEISVCQEWVKKITLKSKSCVARFQCGTLLVKQLDSYFQVWDNSCSGRKRLPPDAARFVATCLGKNCGGQINAGKTARKANCPARRSKSEGSVIESQCWQHFFSHKISVKYLFGNPLLLQGCDYYTCGRSQLSNLASCAYVADIHWSRNITMN